MKKDFTQGHPGKVIFLFAIPMLIGNIFQQLYTTVDSIVVGNFVGKNAIAAIGGTFSIQFLILSLAIGFTTGLSVIISQIYGAKEYEKLKRAFSTSLIFSAALSVVLSIAGVLCTKPMLNLLQTPKEIYQDSYTYLVITFIGFVPMLIYNVYASVLRAVGDSKTPLYFLILAALLNIVLDLVFVIQFSMGVAGVAVATFIAQTVSCITCYFYTSKKIDILSLSKEEYVFDKELLLGIIKYGLPAAIQNSVMSLSFILIQRFVNYFGADMTAAYSVVNKIESFVTMPMMNLATALSMFAGQNIGAGMEDRAKKGAYDTTKIQAAFCLAVFFVLPFIAGLLIELFGMGNDEKVMQIGTTAIKMCSKFYFVYALLQTLSNFLRGVGDTTFSMFTTLCQIFIRLPITYVLIYMMEYGEMSIWVGMIAGWATVAVISLFRFATGGWRGKAYVQNKT